MTAEDVHHGDGSHAERIPEMVPRLEELFKLNRLHLRYLKFHRGYEDTLCWAATALSICPNLNELIVHIPVYYNRRYPRKAPKWPGHRLRLTHLYLGGMTMSTELVDNLLELCPDLKYLGLCPSDLQYRTKDVLNVIYQHRPNLSSLHLYDQDTDKKDRSYLDWKDDGSKEHGLRKMYLGEPVHSADNILEQFFQRCNGTLASLNLNIDATKPAHSCLITLASLGAPSLKNVQFFETPKSRRLMRSDNLLQAMQALVQAAPQPYDIQLRFLNLDDRNEVFENMARLQHLQHITIHCCWNLPKDGLQSLFTKSKSLKSLDFEDFQGSHACVKTLMEALTTKQPEKMVVTSGALNDDMISSKFTSGWKESTMKRLEIRTKGKITWKSLKLLAALPRLTHLTLTWVTKIDENDVYAYLSARQGSAQVVIKEPSSQDLPPGRCILEENGTLHFVPEPQDQKTSFWRRA